MTLSDSFVKKEFTDTETQQLELEEQRKADLLEEMGITQYDVDKLRSMMLSPDEAVIAKTEELERIQQHKGRKKDWEIFLDIKRRMGRVLHHSEIIKKLRTIVPNLLVCRGGQRGRIGLYVIRNVPISEIPGYPLSNRRMSYVECPIYIGWLDKGMSPEYEIDLVNEVQVAIGQRRGWRTLLLRLHNRRAHHCKECANRENFHPDKKGRPTSLVTQEQMLQAFGNPTNGEAASNYRKQLYEFRNGII